MKFRSSQKAPESESAYPKSPYIKSGGPKNPSNHSLPQPNIHPAYKNDNSYEPHSAIIPKTSTEWNKRANSPMNPNKVNRQIISPQDPSWSAGMTGSHQELSVINQ